MTAILMIIVLYFTMQRKEQLDYILKNQAFHVLAVLAICVCADIYVYTQFFKLLING